MIREANPVIALRQDSAQPLLALDIGELGQILAVPLEQVEGK